MPEREKPRYHGHLWIFDGHIAEVLGTPGPGDLVDVYTHQKRFFGRGFYNPHSKIRVRLLTFQEEPIDDAFFAARLRAAAALRRTVACPYQCLPARPWRKRSPARVGRRPVR